MKVNIGISKRHVHLTKEAVKELFGELHIRNELRQPNSFAANETVTLKTDAGIIENVRVVGPERSYNQVELALSDARILGINPPVRDSGDLTGASFIEILTEKGHVAGNFAIIANRHVHMSPMDAKNLGIENNELIPLVIDGEHGGTIDVKAKVLDGSILEVHLDTTDRDAFFIKKDTLGELIEK